MNIQQDLSIPLIAIDGGAGTGKGTESALVAKALGWHRFDSGVLYRALGLLAFRKKLLHTDEQPLVALASNLSISMQDERIILDGVDETELVRSDEAGKLASEYGKLPFVREALYFTQLSMRKLPGLVADGRDMGEVFETEHRFFLKTDPEERARRRVLQFQSMNLRADYDEILAEIIRRDEADTNRSVRPLKPHPKAIIIDNTKLKIGEVATKIVTYYRKSTPHLFS